MLKDRKPDQFIQLAASTVYKSREAANPNGYGGARKQYLDESAFVPVPDANTRVEARSPAVCLCRFRYLWNPSTSFPAARPLP